MQQANLQANTLDSRSPVDLAIGSPPDQLIISNLETNLLEPISGSEAMAVYGGIASPETSTETVRTHPGFAPARLTHPVSDWSESLQNLLDQPPSNLPMRLIVGGIAFCCIFGAWTWWGQIQEVSHAQGKLVPKGEVYKVQPVAQGEVTKLTVTEGQHVKAGQVIAALDNRLAQSEVDRLEQSLVTDRLQLAQTQALIDRTRLEAQAERAIVAAEAQAQIASVSQAETDTATNRQILDQLHSEIAAHETRLSRLQPLAAEGAIAADLLFDAEQSLRERQQVVIQKQGELQRALADTERSQAGLAQKQAEGKKSELEAQQKLQQLKVEATQLQAKIAETENLLKVARTRMEQMFLYATVNGTVSSLKVRNIGEVAQPGQTIAEIAPDHAPLVLSAVLPTREAGFVQKGMPVQMKFDAFPYQDYGIVSGKVTSISPDATVDEHIGAVYRVEIALNHNATANSRQAVEFKSGQTASAEIVTRRRRIIDVLLEPIRRMQTGGINL
jgi:hemolysin D